MSDSEITLAYDSGTSGGKAIVSYVPHEFPRVRSDLIGRGAGELQGQKGKKKPLLPHGFFEDRMRDMEKH